MKTILQQLKNNQKLLTNLDVSFLMDKIQEKEYKQKREELRLNVKKIIIDNKLNLNKLEVNNIL